MGQRLDDGAGRQQAIGTEHTVEGDAARLQLAKGLVPIFDAFYPVDSYFAARSKPHSLSICEKPCKTQFSTFTATPDKCRTLVTPVVKGRGYQPPSVMKKRPKYQ